MSERNAKTSGGKEEKSTRFERQREREREVCVGKKLGGNIVPLDRACRVIRPTSPSTSVDASNRAPGEQVLH